MSAVLTGLLIAMNVPVTLPYWQGVIGSFVAIVIVKQFFGGLGQNFANPAITARIVLFVSFATDMTTWADPTKGRVFSASDAVTSATPLGSIYGRRCCGSGSGILSETALLRNGRRLHG